jgi:hypothetical protein
MFQLLTGNVIKMHNMNLSSQPKCKFEQATRELKLTAANSRSEGLGASKIADVETRSTQDASLEFVKLALARGKALHRKHDRSHD